MTKRQVDVFPDYTSTGLWLVSTKEERKLHESSWEHVSICPSDVFVSPTLQLALKYWHDMWEFCIAHQYSESDTKFAMSKSYVDKWKEDGKKLAELMSAENQNYEFVYKD